jgi:hypothetical protein
MKTSTKAYALCQHVAPVQRGVDLHQVAQRQRYHGHSDQRIEQKKQPRGAGVRGEVARADEGHAATSRIHRGDKVGRRLAFTGPDGCAKCRLNDQSGPDRQPESPDANQQHEDHRTVVRLTWSATN